MDLDKDSRDALAKVCRCRIGSHYKVKLLSCIDVLNERDLWAKSDRGNSIESIIHHMLAHLRLLMPSNTEPSIVDGPRAQGIEDFFPERGLSREALGREVDECFTRFDAFLTEMYAAHPPESRECIEPDRLLHLVEHLSYHLGQVVLLTRMRTGHEFHFVQAGINEAQLQRLLNP